MQIVMHKLSDINKGGQPFCWAKVKTIILEAAPFVQLFVSLAVVRDLLAGLCSLCLNYLTRSSFMTINKERQVIVTMLFPSCVC